MSVWLGPARCAGRTLQTAQSRPRRNREMRSLLCVTFVFLFAASAAAQFKNPPPRSTTRSNTTTERKTAEKGTDRATKAADQATAETDLANSLLAIMDTDGDGIVTKIE